MGSRRSEGASQDQPAYVDILSRDAIHRHGSRICAEYDRCNLSQNRHQAAYDEQGPVGTSCRFRWVRAGL